MFFPEFKLERYFARYEFTAERLLCCSDIQGWSMGDVLALADDECRGLWEGLTLGYTESAGHPLLRREIAGLYGLEAEDILTFAGAEEAILAALSVLLGPGDHALVTWPGYQSLHEVARHSGADVERLELREEDGWRLPALRLRPNTKLVVVNFPHNPTGAVLTRPELDELLALPVRVFSDEVYRGLEYGPTLPAAASLSESALSLGVMSKAYGMAGLRIGWLACRDRALLRRIAAFKDYTTICSSAPAEILALIALRAGDRVLARNRALVERNLKLVDELFARHPDRLRWVRPQAGCIGFPRLLRGDVEEFCRELVERESTLLLPGSVYDFPGQHFRLGYGRADLAAGLERLERQVAKLP